MSDATPILSRELQNAAFLAALPCDKCEYRNGSFCQHPLALESDGAMGGANRSLDAERAMHNAFGVQGPRCSPRGNWFAATRAVYLDIYNTLVEKTKVAADAQEYAIYMRQEADVSWSRGCLAGGVVAIAVVAIIGALAYVSGLAGMS